MSKPSPAPWFNEGTNVFDADDCLVAVCCSTYYDNVDLLAANAQLIAAAPALAQAARAVIDNWEHGDLAKAVNDLEAALNVSEIEFI